MILEHEMSFINVAEVIIKERKEPMDLYDLFDAILAQKNVQDLDEEKMVETLNTFYADLTSSAKFVYTGGNTWDLKEHQNVELWEKDGSFYSEYKEIHDEVMEARLEAAARRELEHQEMLEKRKEREAMLQAARESQESPALNAEETVTFEEETLDEEVLVEETLEPVAEEPAEDASEAQDLEADFGDLEEEVLEDDDFDEEEYNKRMDEFEDLYEDD